jgi:mono/diheme cytochrome c family protein
MQPAQAEDIGETATGYEDRARRGFIRGSGWGRAEGKEISMGIADKRFRMALQLAVAIALLSVAPLGVARQTQNKPPNAEQKTPPLIRSVEGPDLYRAYCASCHGLDARGTGPAAPSMKAKVPDLTLLTKNHRNEFPADYVRQVIVGGVVVNAHGWPGMPIWGPIFHHVQRDMDWGDVRVAGLVEYLRKIQSTIPAKIPLGAEIYAQDCAVCHGDDLKGVGDSLYPYKAPPDLTTLTRKYGGKFPDAYFATVVNNGATIPAHGLAQMPVWGTDLSIAPWTESELAQRIASLTNFVKANQRK